MSDPHASGNAQPAIDKEEHNHSLGAKKVSLVAASASGSIGGVNIYNSDGTDNSYSSGGQIGQKVMVVGDSDKHVRGVVAANSALTGIEPVAIGFKDATGNNQFMLGDTTNGQWVNVKATVSPSVTGTVTANQGTAAANSGKWPVIVTDGTNTMPTGDASARTIHVTADNSSITVTQSTASNLKVDLSGTAANSTAIKVDGSAVSQPAILKPTTSGGLTTYHLASGASTNATSVKASAGQLYGWYIYNSNSAARKLAFHNTSGTPTAGSSIYFSIVIPATSAANVFSDIGLPFSSGIGITTVTGLADSDSTGVAANDLIINLWYS